MSSPPDDDPRDPHLVQALRHAPDDAAPPAAVRDAILRAARDAAAPRPAPWWQRLSDWLVRPQVAGAFASLAVVTVAGLLWHDEPVPPMSVPEPAVVHDAPTAAAPSPSAAEIVVARESAAPPPAATAAKRSARAERPPPRTDAEVIAPPVAPKPEPATVPHQQDAVAGAAESAAPPPPIATAPPTLPEDARADARSKAAVPDAPRDAERRIERLRAAAPAAATAPAFAPDASALGPLRRLIAASHDWRWQRETGEAREMDERLLSWLALLDRTVTAWTPVDAPRTGAAELLLIHDGHTAHRFVLADDGLWWFGPGGGRRAEIDATGLRRLRTALP